jgi:hypothetical protein
MFETEIAEGMEWLDGQDAREPWLDPWFSASRVNTATLDLLHPSTCMIGQSQPSGHSYDTLMDIHGVQWMESHGFTIGLDTDFTLARNHQWQILTAEWILAIRTRRNNV